VLTQQIRTVFADEDETYDYRRVWAQLDRQGVACGPELVRAIMRRDFTATVPEQPWETMPGISSAGGLFRGEELAEVSEDLGFVGVGGTHAYVSVRSDDQQRIAVDAVVPVGVALIVDEVGHIRFGRG
jgi:hypothetical protein